MSQSVKQCFIVDLIPHILANAVDIQKVHLLLHTPLLNKTPRLSSARMFVRLYRLLLIHCIYVSVTKPTCPAFSAWLNTGAIRSMNVPGRVAQSVTCLATDACLTADPGVASLIPVRSHTFVEIYHEMISTVILLLPLIHSRRVVVSYKGKYVHELLVNRLFKSAQEKVWLCELTVLQWP